MIPLKISPELEVWSECQEIFICSITKAGDTVLSKKSNKSAILMLTGERNKITA